MNNDHPAVGEARPQEDSETLRMLALRRELDPDAPDAIVLPLPESSSPAQARKIADEIISFTFDDYPDNDMNRGQLVEHVATIISRHFPVVQDPAAIEALVKAARKAEEWFSCFPRQGEVAASDFVRQSTDEVLNGLDVALAPFEKGDKP